MKRIISVRLYRNHDLDLVTMKMNRNYHLGREMKRALIAKALDEPYVAPLFKGVEEPAGCVAKSMLIHIHFDTEKQDEAEALELLSTVRNGIRCGYIKALFRSSCAELPLEGFHNENRLPKKKDTVRRDQQIKNDRVQDKRKKQCEETCQKQEGNNIHLIGKPKVQPYPAERGNSLVKEKVPETGPESMMDFDLLFGAMDELGHQ